MSKQEELASSRGDTAGKLYTACRRHADYYKSMLSRANHLYLYGGDGMKEGLSLADQEWSNIALGQKWSASQVGDGVEVEVAVELCSKYADVAVHICLFGRFRNVYSSRLSPDDSLRMRFKSQWPKKRAAFILKPD